MLQTAVTDGGDDLFNILDHVESQLQSGNWMLMGWWKGGSMSDGQKLVNAKAHVVNIRKVGAIAKWNPRVSPPPFTASPSRPASDSGRLSTASSYDERYDMSTDSLSDAPSPSAAHSIRKSAMDSSSPRQQLATASQSGSSQHYDSSTETVSGPRSTTSHMSHT